MQFNTSLKPYAMTAWGWIVWAAKGLWASVAAFIASPQVWLAGCVCAFLGYSAGFAVLKPKIVSLNASNAALQASKTTLTTERNRLRDEVAQLKEAVTKAALPPVVAVPTPVTRKPKPVVAAPVAADKPWWQVFP